MRVIEFWCPNEDVGLGIYETNMPMAKLNELIKECRADDENDGYRL